MKNKPAMPLKNPALDSVPLFGRRLRGVARKISFFTSLLLSCAAASLLNPVQLLGVDQVIRLYICQTEHDLNEITSWEYTAPEKYRQATKDGKRTPLDAARESAGYFVGTDKIECNADNQVVVERSKSEGGKTHVHKALLGGPELEAYCPKTIKKYGNLCAP